MVFFTSSQRPIVVAFETRLFVGFVLSFVIRDPDVENMGSIESSEPIMKIKRLFNANEIYEVRRYSDFSAAIALFSVVFAAFAHGSTLKGRTLRRYDE